MEMEKQAELKKKKTSTVPTIPAIPPKFKMKLALIIATAGPMQGQPIGIQTSLGAAQSEQCTITNDIAFCIHKK
uniref:Uncharacterized protein n=1 Tax=Romanomermis culicivorax TaxID=13658 RepID=A0A915KYN3_ROMCU